MGHVEHLGVLLHRGHGGGRVCVCVWGGGGKVQIQILYSPSFTTRKVSRKR